MEVGEVETGYDLGEYIGEVSQELNGIVCLSVVTTINISCYL